MRVVVRMCLHAGKADQGRLGAAVRTRLRAGSHVQGACVRMSPCAHAVWSGAAGRARKRFCPHV